MTTLSSDEQELFDFSANSLPDWYSDTERANEYLGACAKIFGNVKLLARDWLGKQVFIQQADGPDTGKPDWLNGHAIDRGTFRQAGEGSDPLRVRLRAYPVAVTRPLLLGAVTAKLIADGITDPPAFVELPRDATYAGRFVAETGTGGTFAAVAGGNAVFTPNVKFNGLPYLPVFPQFTRKLIFTGAASSGNNGTFTTTGVVVNGAKYANGSVVAGADSGVSWTLHKYDRRGNLVDGFAMSYAGRGYRYGSRLPTLIVILPYPTTANTAAAIHEMLRTKKSAGVFLRVERRLVP